ncbi:apolipoprotein N-acyltransferase [Aestuariivirga sp.]|uniref:apolipoprotein N-acyltransferase n=1 Tax=Aestuariivirga sp. TaxID=2650926 RepID=UPI0039E3B8FA
MIRIAEQIRAMRGWRRVCLAFGAGAVMALGLPPLDLWPLAFLAVPVFLLLLETGAGARAFWLGWVFGFGYFIVALHWIGFAFFVDAAVYLWMMPFAVGGLAAFMAIYWGLAAWVARLLHFQGFSLITGFAALLSIAEWLRGHLFTGFPWAAPGLMVDGMGGVAQSASVTGMTGLTLLIVLWAGLLLKLEKRRTWVLLALLPMLWGLGAWRLSSSPPADVPGIALRLVQPDIAQNEKWREDNARHIFDTLLALSVAPTPEHPDGLSSVTHVIWPESAVPFFIDESPVAKQDLGRLLGGHTVLITGSLRRGKSRTGPDGDEAVFNSIITFDGNADVVARYDKWRLVPGGEFLPLQWLLEPLGFKKVVTLPGSFVPGPGPVTISVPGSPPAAMLVCYEAIFPQGLIDALHRPAWIVNVTNDGWFGNSTGPWQHLAQARLRAIEQGLPMIRDANTGVSAVIDAKGRIRKFLGIGQQGIIDAALPAADPATLYGRFGDLAFAFMALLAFALSMGKNPGFSR